MRVAAWWNRAVSTVASLPKPLKVLLVATAAAMVLLVSYFSLSPLLQSYAVMYTQLDQEDAGAIVAKLKEAKVPFRLAAGGTTIEVPEDQVQELRLTMAVEGLPRGGQIGFEGFENMRLGATEFEQHVIHRRAMEGELARTIAAVRDVQSARVHLVMPKKSVFSSRDEPASASIVIKPIGAGKLSQSEVKGIVFLVASAVPSLEPERVTLVTTDGRMLHQAKGLVEGGEHDGLSVSDHDQAERNRSYEALLEERTRSMLERVLGPGRVDVRIRADLDSAKLERKTDTYNRDTTALRSERMVLEGAGAGALPEDTVAGVPGAESNLPGGDEEVVEEPGDGAAPAGLRRSHTRNWEVDHVQERRVSLVHEVKRLTVAVVVDGVSSTVDGKPVVEARPQEELDNLAELVRSAVGYDEQRGDMITVKSVPFFAEDLADEPGEAELIPAAYSRWVPLGKQVAIGIGALIVLLVVRSKWRRWTAQLPKQADPPKRLATADAPPELTAGREQDSQKLIDYRAEAVKRAREDAPTAGLVIRHWLGTSDSHGEPDEAA